MSIMLTAYLGIKDFLAWREEKGRKSTGRAVDEILRDESLECLRRAVPDYRRRTAVHEAGHAVALAALLPNRLIDVKINAFDNDDGEHPDNAFGSTKIFTAMMSREERLHVITMLYAGIAAERLVLDTHLDGCGNDLESAARLALEIACFWMKPAPIDSSVCEDERTKSQVLAILSKANADAEKLVLEHRPAVDAIAKALEKKGSLDRDEILAFMCLVR